MDLFDRSGNKVGELFGGEMNATGFATLLVILGCVLWGVFKKSMMAWYILGGWFALLFLLDRLDVLDTFNKILRGIFITAVVGALVYLIWLTQNQ